MEALVSWNPNGVVRWRYSSRRYVNRHVEPGELSPVGWVKRSAAHRLCRSMIERVETFVVGVAVLDPPYEITVRSAHVDKRDERAVCFAFKFTGVIYLAIGVPGLFVGAFAGPQVLLPAFGFLIIGMVTIAVSYGVAAGSRLARVAGVTVALMLTTVSLSAAFGTLREGGDHWPAAFFWIATVAPVTAAGWTLLWPPSSRRCQTTAESPTVSSN